ncbi:hypothetical protein PIB30_081557 [Stylosanthes scabra]|uniref:Uncharacterized protein n=1 Tax=Stylosanthes scabra TaxID=79078 RepID=A0ABU6YUH5_9FABA|nr:hypothetical protein [Stylosanthes scabra]
MEDLSMFQRPRTIAMEDENPGIYGTVLIYPLNLLVECGFVGDTAVNPWMRTLGLMEGVDLPTRPIGRVWLRGLHAKHLYLGISGVYGDTRYTPWNPTLYQPHDLGYNAYQSNGFGDAYYGYEDPSPPYPPSQNGMDKLFKALAQERNEIREA